jgi:hypothetical protein
MSPDVLLERNELRTYLDEELAYPVTLGVVRDRVGETTIVAPDSDQSETIETVLKNVDEADFEAVDELFETVVSRLPDAYIGRKYYDDRGSNPDPQESEDESL